MVTPCRGSVYQVCTPTNRKPKQSQKQNLELQRKRRQQRFFGVVSQRFAYSRRHAEMSVHRYNPKKTLLPPLPLQFKGLLLTCTTNSAAPAVFAGAAPELNSRGLDSRVVPGGGYGYKFRICLPEEFSGPSTLILGQSLVKGKLGLDDIQPDFREPAVHFQHSCRCVAQIEDALADIGAAIIYTDNDPFAVPQIGDLDPGAQRELFMGRREFEHVKVFTTGGRCAVEGLTVPK